MRKTDYRSCNKLLPPYNPDPMRNELEQLEKIHLYLSGQLSAAEKQAFEEQLAVDASLQKEVRLQQEILKGIGRTILKQQISKAATRFKLVRKFIRWGFTGLAVLLLAAAIWYYKGVLTHALSAYEGGALPEYNESGGKDWADADRNLAAQTFWVDGSADTVIETKGGIVLSVPAAAFVDDNGQTVRGKIGLVIKEALDPASILRAGLSTKSGDRLLETGGMFFVDARKNTQSLKIDPLHAVYAEVPADSIKPGMQLFSGRRMKDGSIDWTNPRPLEHDLTPIDILSLDFYPPHYLDSLRKWGYPSQDKKFTDSLYYSFAQYFGKPDAEPVPERVNTEDYQDAPANSSSYAGAKTDTTGFQADSAKTRAHIPEDRYGENYPDGPPRDTSYSNDRHTHCGINPAKIKTIWSEPFQNTLLSTREFEQRLALIHACGNSRVLDLYIHHLDKRLSTIDSMAARLVTGSWKERLLSFAARQDGRVRGASRQFDKLREYYEKKTSAFTAAITKTQNDYRRKQQQLDDAAARKRLEHRSDSINRLQANLQKEFMLNLKEAYRQLGYGPFTRIPNSNRYQVPVTATGWWNIDKFVYESTVNRTSLDYTDTSTGRKAVIRYLPVSFQLARSSEYDRVYFYLLPDRLSSFQRLQGSGGIYTEQLNELIKYKLVCMAYAGKQAYFYSQDNVGAGPTGASPIPVSLRALSEKELEEQLASTGSQAEPLQKEQRYFQFEIGDRDRQQRKYEQWILMQKTLLLIFPCCTEGENECRFYTFVDTLPV